MKSSKATQPRILLVDDGQILLGGICDALQDAGMLLETTTSPHEAMRRLEAEAFDAVVADQDTPELAGLELLAWAEKHHGHVLRYLLAGKPTHAAAIEAMNEGVVQRFFGRPVNPSELIRAIHQELYHKALVESAFELTQRARAKDFSEREALPADVERILNADDPMSEISRSTGELLEEMRQLLDHPAMGTPPADTRRQAG